MLLYLLEMSLWAGPSCMSGTAWWNTSQLSWVQAQVALLLMSLCYTSCLSAEAQSSPVSSWQK